MPAGDSAGAETRRQLAIADAHEQAAIYARATASRFSIAEVTERQTAEALAPLAALGYHLLADRAWPGSRRAQVDMVVVGPGGVFIVDTKAWAEVSIHAGRIHRGQEDVTDSVMSLADLGYTTEADLAEVGLAPGEVRPVVVLAGRQGVDERVGPVRVLGQKDVTRYIAGHGSRLTPAQVDVVLGRTLALFPLVGAPAPVVATVPAPVVPQAPERVLPAEPQHQLAPVQDALLSDAQIQDALLAGILASPVEEWMAFLHPNQAKVVRRSFNGPSRIRGSAGTGKTVVGLHRAAYLARTRPGSRVLVTTYVRTLPAVLGRLLERLAPDVVDQVQFTSIHALARRVLDERGVPVRIDPRATDDAFSAAWRDVGRHGPLGRAGLPLRYWKEEVTVVLKGRGITDPATYADLARTGRKHRLTVEMRRAVWDLHLAYDAELRRRGLRDFADLVLLAEAEVRRVPLAEPYDAVVVDEAQDLSCAMVRMLHAMVGDRQDGLTLIGDGQQSIYPGGYTLAEAGVSLAGRGVVMDVNYRNTAQVLAFATRMVDGDEFPDIEGAVARGDVPETVPRTGPEPVVERCASGRVRLDRMVARARAVVREVGTGMGDVGVLCTTNAGADRAATALRRAGAAVVMLTDYDGVPVDAVKVGTVKRAKGLEFKQVLLPEVRADQIGEAVPPADDAAREGWERTRRELYVAMTRARDGLWVGVV